MEQTSHPKIVSFAAILLGAVVAILVTLHPEQLKAPAWIAYLAAAIFSLAGVTGLARAHHRNRLADTLICLVLGGMFLMSLWISLGPGPRNCKINLAGIDPELGCRSAFGLGAILIGLMLAIALTGIRRNASAG